MSMNSSSVLSSTSSLDSSFSDEETNIILHPLRKFNAWRKRPNQVPNGRLLLVLVTLGVVTFGTARGVIYAIDESNRDVCFTRAESREANRGNFLDLYQTVLDISGPETQPLVAGLIERMNQRTPPFSIEDC